MLLYFGKELRGSLSVVVDLFLAGLPLYLIFNGLNIHHIFIRQFRIGIQALLSFLIPLFMSKYVVNPSSYVLRYVLRFKHFPQINDKQVWVILTPRRQRYVVNNHPVLLSAEVYFVGVYVHFWGVVKLRG